MPTIRPCLLALALAFLTAACKAAPAEPPCPSLPAPDAVVDCGDGGTCPTLAIEGHPPATTQGSFRGYADPALFHDPDVPERVWLAYSWPRIEVGRDPQGRQALMATVSNFLARSDDGGASFKHVGELWPAKPMLDPEGSGQTGLLSSETASLAAAATGGATTWYGAHLRYFLLPQTGYHPKYATSWTVRVGAAPTPQALATTSEAALGVSSTAAAYGVQARLDQLAGVPLEQCAMLNNPALFAQGGQLYLIVECLAFVGTTPDPERSTVQVFATSPDGPAPTWRWRHAGVLADHGLAEQLADQTIQQPDVSLAADGAPVLIVTPAHADASQTLGTIGDGCAVVELASIDPPALKRHCSGEAIVRARITGQYIGACTHDARSRTGILATRLGQGGASWSLRVSGVHP